VRVLFGVNGTAERTMVKLGLSRIVSGRSGIRTDAIAIHSPLICWIRD
jgi:hypothetical protein